MDLPDLSWRPFPLKQYFHVLSLVFLLLETFIYLKGKSHLQGFTIVNPDQMSAFCPLRKK